MKPIVKLMINETNVMNIGIDFMGYKVLDPSLLSFHHLIVPKKLGGKEIYDNGALLMRYSHDYLHIIEETDRRIYNAIKEEMIKENLQHEVRLENIIAINEWLNLFEEVHIEDTTKDGRHLLIKDIFRRRYLKES